MTVTLRAASSTSLFPERSRWVSQWSFMVSIYLLALGESVLDNRVFRLGGGLYRPSDCLKTVVVFISYWSRDQMFQGGGGLFCPSNYLNISCNLTITECLNKEAAYPSLSDYSKTSYPPNQQFDSTELDVLARRRFGPAQAITLNSFYLRLALENLIGHLSIHVSRVSFNNHCPDKILRSKIW